MTYDFRSLLPADFEDLTRDLVGASLGVRFEAFGVGPDGGADGRHASAGGTLILQAKHYADSSFPALKSALKRERASIDQLAPGRYLLATSRSLSPGNRAALAAVIGQALQKESDLYGKDDLNSLLRRYPDIERAHLKLWLSSAAVLGAIVNAASHAFTATTHQEISAKVRVYAQNPSLAHARKILDQRHVLIVSGPPGVGKTTLAEILAFAYLGDDWELVAIHSLDDGFARINDARKQVFFFDDFLGTVALDRRALAASDSALAMFMRRVRDSPNARFILTTRAYILNEARSVSERLADDRIDLSTYVLNMEVYSRGIRARILYNHLAVGRVSADHIDALLDCGKLAAIVDHPNYNPRLVEWMTDALRIEDIAPGDYPKAFLATLNKPTKLWDNAFRNQISPACRHLLVALFFLEIIDADIPLLRKTFDRLHGALCREYSIPQDPKDFEDSLKRLEGGFVVIGPDGVKFINPSIGDYLSDYLEDGSLLPFVATSVSTGRDARAVWDFARSKMPFAAQQLKHLALTFLPLTEVLKVARHWKVSSDHSWESIDINNATRVELLLDWWSASADRRFIAAALALAANPPQGFSGWRDSEELLELIPKIEDSGYFEPFPEAPQLRGLLEKALVEMLDHGVSSDELERISDRIQARRDYGRPLSAAVERAIVHEVDNARQVVEDMNSESDLSDHADALKRLAPRANVPPKHLAAALEVIEERIAVIEEYRPSSEEPSALPRAAVAEGLFDDASLHALFQSLRSQR